MKLYLSGHAERYAMEQMQLSLFPEEPMEFCTAPFSGDGAVSALHEGSVWLTAVTTITMQGRSVRRIRRCRAQEADLPARRRLLQQCYYQAALPLLPQAPAWGALSGVRPTKLTTRHLLAGGTPESAAKMMQEVYFVSPARSKLCADASEATVYAASLLAPQDVSVYIGVPFCPTRCAYCSFVSQSIEKFSDLVEPFLEALLREIAHTGQRMAASPMRVRTIYIGGGTPTTLSAAQLARLMDAVAEHFDLSDLLEYTVEGGRPDTLDVHKLALIREKGADRMSINPQTMSDAVLAAIGRRHTTTQTLEAFAAAREAGFEGINMDLIAGLPGDDAAGFARSLEAVLDLGPSNITVHTLALKRAAALYHDRAALPPVEAVAAMVDGATKALRNAGYRPYYLYRQKYMSGSFENVGWCKPGWIGLYNIYMMEELHTVVSMGGGGMSKLNLPSGRIARQHNPKFPGDYIRRIDDVLAQKDTMFALLTAPVSKEI